MLKNTTDRNNFNNKKSIKQSFLKKKQKKHSHYNMPKTEKNVRNFREIICMFT